MPRSPELPARPRPREGETAQPASSSEELAGAGMPTLSSRRPPSFAVEQPAIGSWVHPLIASQRSCVHALPSSQLPQAVQAAAPGPDEVSGAHAVHAFAPAPANVPAGHAVHVAAPAVAAICPAGHGVHALAPAADVVPGSHFVQVVAPAFVVNEPAGHAVQTAFAVVVHAVAWNVPASQTLHALHLPPLRKNDDGQLPHWLEEGPEHAVQLASHAPHAVSVVAVHAADWYVPEPHTLHAVHVPPFRNLFAVQLAHSALLGPVHVPQLALHAPQTVFAFAVQAETSYSLALHVLQARHWPPLLYLFAAQLVHWFAPGPEHVAQLPLQGAQTVFAVTVQAETWYSLAPHVEQVRHCPPLL